MTMEEAKNWIEALITTMKEETSGICPDVEYRDEIYEALDMAIKALRQTDKIKALGEELRIIRDGIKDEDVLIGFNMAVAICNKHLAEGSEE